MAFTQQQLNDIEIAIATGARSVSYEGKTTTFGSLSEMLLVRGLIMRALGLVPSSSMTVLAAHDRGYPGSSTEAYVDSELYTGQ